MQGTGMAPREDLPGDALSRGVGRMGRVRPPEGEGQAQVSAFRVLHDDRRTLEIKMSGKDGEDILKGGTERLRRGRYGNDPVQGFQIPGQRAIKPVYAFFLHVPQRLEGASPAAGAAVTSQASSCRLPSMDVADMRLEGARGDVQRLANGRIGRLAGQHSRDHRLLPGQAKFAEMRLHLLDGPFHEGKRRPGNLFGGALAASHLGLGQTEKAHLFQIGHKDKTARKDGEGLKRKKGIQGIPTRDAVSDPTAVMAAQP